MGEFLDGAMMASASCKDCGSSDGPFYASWPEVCAECRRKRQKAYYAANQERYQDNVRRYRHANKDRIAAASAVQRAIRDGGLTPEPCFTCGLEKTEAHHASYARDMWLIVTWLCRSCHRQVHQEAA